VSDADGESGEETIELVAKNFENFGLLVKNSC
jgi:hypothetical protein